jgi:hypothetical protein
VVRQSFRGVYITHRFLGRHGGHGGGFRAAQLYPKMYPGTTHTHPVPLVPGTGVDVLPRSGDVLRVTRAASVQFATPMLFRVIRVLDWSTYNGWAWLDGYQLNGVGDAVERRSIFVQVAGLQAAAAKGPAKGPLPGRYRTHPTRTPLSSRKR